MAGSRELLDSLKPGMHLDKNFFLKVYGHEITRPGFAENVIKRLEILGCSKAREYYTCVVTELAKASGISTNALKNAKAALKSEKAIHTWGTGNGYTGKKYLIALTAPEKPNE